MDDNVLGWDRGCASGSRTVLRRPTAADRLLLDVIQRSLGREAVRVQLWDGASTYPSTRMPAAVVTIRDRSTLMKVVWNPEFWFAESLMRGSIVVSGDLMAMLDAAYSHRAPSTRLHDWIDRVRALAESHSRHSLHGSRHNIHKHYDLGNDFYRLWLDRDLVYTCAYFETPEVTLEDAQRAKLDHVCRKLRLRPGERVIEAGCGWGALALHMAARYGVSVRAFNISREQIALARERAAERGVAGRVEFIEDDYRNIDGECDVFVSVGMLEHVGREHYRQLGEVIHRVLDPDHGRGLLHFIGRNQSRPLAAWIRKRIFPGGYAPTLSEVASGVLEPWDLSMLDVENLRLHYAKTLAHWRARFETVSDRVAGMFDEQFVRAWRLYLAGSETAFATGWMQLFQVTFGSSRDNRLPWTRADLYK